MKTMSEDAFEEVDGGLVAAALVIRAACQLG